MVSNPRGTSDTRRIRRLKAPGPIEVETDETEAPHRVRLAGQWRDVSLVRRPWRIDQHWWRSPVSRIYYRVTTEEGAPLTIYRDLVTREWFRQEY